MPFEIPDTFDDVEKIFKESEEDIPADISDYQDIPIFHLIKKAGNAIIRLEKFMKLQAPAVIIENSRSLCLKYKAVLMLRREEFCEHINKINSGKDLTNEFIMQNLLGICVAITHQILQEEDRRIAEIPRLTSEVLGGIQNYLKEHSFKLVFDSESEICWIWEHPDKKFPSIYIKIDQQAKGISYVVSKFEEDWDSDSDFIDYRDYTLDKFKQIINEQLLHCQENLES